MRVLLLHPEDDPAQRAGRQKFDVAFDLGTAGPACYERWSGLLQCPVRAVPRPEFADFSEIGRIFSIGTRRMVDDLGLDFWGLISIRFYEPLLEILRLRRFLEGCPPGDQIFVSRRCFQSRVLKLLHPGKVHELAEKNSFLSRVCRVSMRVRGLRLAQTLEIIQDKYDACYRWRRKFARRKGSGSEPVVLLPSAYGNASQTQLAYASSAPERRFLLVCTRRSGNVQDRPNNVASASLAAYASGKPSRPELDRLLGAWNQLLQEFRQSQELSILLATGQLADVPRLLEQGLVMRDAWRHVFECEHIAAVLCADEMNWNTRLPLLLAQLRGIPTLACHHGALDVRYSFRETSAGRILVKGAMERDYLKRLCGCDPDKLETGGPPQKSHAFRKSEKKGHIVFFSEPYENLGARCAEVYAELLPPLAELAVQNGCELLLKLHPYESLSQRRRMARKTLLRNRHHALRVVDGRLQPALLERAWFALSITSTAAVDAALHRVPVFLCEWLNGSGHKYSEQFMKFGVAKPLLAAEQIRAIPQMLESFGPTDSTQLWEPIHPQRLRALLSGKADEVLELEAERLWA